MYSHVNKSWNVKCVTVNDIFKGVFPNYWKNSSLERDLNCEIENIWGFAYLSIGTFKVVAFLILSSLYRS